jgi:hypothetical protein
VWETHPRKAAGSGDAELATWKHLLQRIDERRSYRRCVSLPCTLRSLAELDVLGA